ncbi:MAG TPA: MBL fold metallo-hydrolase, partial [Xanthobacteraceae bacterium]|nr:MBL fold metallo-hydrolase [Xanthobacteraceae bacterium]
SDGPLKLGTFTTEMFKGITQERIDEILATNFLDKSNFTIDQNALVVNTGGKLVLIDTGMGFRKVYGPRTGHLLSNLRAAGIDPASIDVVALSHGHPDHVWGLVGEDGKPNFPNAQIYITQADLEYWTDEAKLSDPALGHYIGPIRDTLLPLRDRIVFLKDGQDVVAGVQALSTPGHTVGHTSFVISSQGSSLVNIADLGHQPQLQMENPRAEFARDTDPQQGVTTRLRVFDMVASQKIPIVAYHFPWPGLGHVAKNGEAYRYVAVEMQTVL